MKRRRMKGIPRLINGVCFGNVDDSFRAPLHRKLGIETYVHRQAILADLIPGGRGKKGEDGWGYDPVNRCWSNNHLFRASITLPKVFA